jgi:hypothetical protein
MKYQLAENCPKTIIVQSLPSGDYDYSEHGSLEAAWEAEKSEGWVQEHAEHEGNSIETAKAEFLESLSAYSQNEAIEAAQSGYTWPVKLGFVDGVDGDE